MLINTFSFIEYQDKLYISYKRMKFLQQHVTTLKYLQNHQNSHPQSVLRPYYNVYQKMLRKKIKELAEISVRTKLYENIIIYNKIYYIPLIYDIKLYISEYVNPL
tara:strand:+ start:7121 stop:7435 length:315 start_codon:yes stop_codon:yes gene_type:complete